MKHRLLLLMVAGLLVVGIASCGSAGSTTKASTGSTATICGAMASSQAHTDSGTLGLGKSATGGLKIILNRDCLRLARKRGVGSRATLHQAQTLALAFASEVTQAASTMTRTAATTPAATTTAVTTAARTYAASRACPGGIGNLVAGPHTSCPFAVAVERAAFGGPSVTDETVSAYSSVTRETYHVHCSSPSSGPVTCATGAASVQFPLNPAACPATEVVTATGCDACPAALITDTNGQTVCPEHPLSKQPDIPTVTAPTTTQVSSLQTTTSDVTPDCSISQTDLDGSTVISGWDTCTNTLTGAAFTVEWFIDPDDKPCSIDVGADGPSGTRRTFDAYIGYDACAVVTQGSPLSWATTAHALATQRTVAVGARVLQES